MTGAQKVVEIDDDNKLRAFYDKRMSHEVGGDSLGDDFRGYVFKISGGNDKQGFCMTQGILTTGRVRILMREGMPGYRIRRRGERKRKSARGCIVSSDLSVLNLVIVKKGEQDIEGLTTADAAKPRRLGPKRASKIRKLFNLSKEDDVRQFVVRRAVAKEGKKTQYKAPKIQRLVSQAAGQAEHSAQQQQQQPQLMILRTPRLGAGSASTPSVRRFPVGLTRCSSPQQRSRHAPPCQHCCLLLTVRALPCSAQVTPQRLQHKRQRLALKRERYERTKADALAYSELLARRHKEQSTARASKVAARRSSRRASEANPAAKKDAPAPSQPVLSSAPAATSTSTAPAPAAKAAKPAASKPAVVKAADAASTEVRATAPKAAKQAKAAKPKEAKPAQPKQ